jgi:hypothetical protein
MRRAPFLLFIAAVLAVIVVPIVFLDRDDDPLSEPTPTPSVVAAPREIRTIPQLDADAKQDLIAGLQRALVELYGRAFDINEREDDTPSPEPSPATRVDDLFTENARAALRRDPNVFRLIEDLDVGSGRVNFSGVVTLEDSKPVHAALEIEFVADALPTGRTAPVVRLRQLGTLILVARPEGWRVAAFDVAFSTRPQTSPSPKDD